MIPAARSTSTVFAASVHARVVIALVGVQWLLYFQFELTRTVFSIHDKPLRVVCLF